LSNSRKCELDRREIEQRYEQFARRSGRREEVLVTHSRLPLFFVFFGLAKAAAANYTQP
jgi:hypothetical protein